MTNIEGNDDQDMKILASHCAQLSEHFDTVQIFVTRKSEDGTINCNYGEGNWFARYGHVKIWLKKEEQNFTIQEIE